MQGNKSLLISSLLFIGAAGLWGVLDPETALSVSNRIVDRMFESRGWFVMLTVSGLLAFCLWLAASRFGKIRLGADDERPEFSTPAWLAMLFSAGMGVGLLFWAAAEPLTHYRHASVFLPKPLAAEQAIIATLFHWGIHAWAVYGATALAIAYFAFRRGTPMLVSAPLNSLFPGETWARIIGWITDFLAIAAIAIGVSGSIAMGVFQVADGIDFMMGGDGAGSRIIWAVFAALVLCYLPPLLVDLGDGMSRLSNIAMGLALFLVVFVVLAGPTEFMLNSVLNGFGLYLAEVIPRGLQTFTFFDDTVGRWFKDWTLTYMVWWIAWGPFVGVFIARISRGRTIREFVLGVLFVPTAFSIVWFGVFGGIGLFDTLQGNGDLLNLTQSNVERVTFDVLNRLPLSGLTALVTVAAAFLFIITSVVSAAFVLGTFSTGGDPDPRRKVRLLWGLLLAVLGGAMILSGTIDAVKSFIALGALPFVFVIVLLVVCLARAIIWEDS